MTGPILVTGRASEPELAALAAALAALCGAAVGTRSEPPASLIWRSHRRSLGLPVVPGPGAWRASGLP